VRPEDVDAARPSIDRLTQEHHLATLPLLGVKQKQRLTPPSSDSGM